MAHLILPTKPTNCVSAQSFQWPLVLQVIAVIMHTRRSLSALLEFLLSLRLAAIAHDEPPSAQSLSLTVPTKPLQARRGKLPSYYPGGIVPHNYHPPQLSR